MAVADAKNKILEWRDMQVKAAKDAGASHEEFQAIYTRAAQMIASVSDQNTSKILRNLEYVSEKQKRVAEAMSQLGKIPIGSGEPISARSAASAAIQFGEGHQGIRSIENFVARIPGVSQALQALFPILGSAGLLGLVAHLGEEVYDFERKLEALPNAIAQNFEGLNQPMEMQLDTLRKTNDELEISISNLEHKPANTLALAFDEITIAADQAASSARKSALDIQKALSENRVGLFQGLAAGLFTGQVQGVTTGIERDINEKMSAIAAAEREYKDKVRQSNPEDAKRLSDDHDRYISSLEGEALQYIKNKRTEINGFVEQRDGIGNYLGKVKYSDLYGSQSANNNILNATQDLLDNRADTRVERQRGADDEEQKKKLENQHKLAQQAAEAQRKAIELQRQGWQQEDDAIKQAGGDSAALLTFAWQTRIDALSKGAGNYAYAQNQFTEHLVAMRHEDAEAQKKANEQAQQSQRESWDVDHDAWTSAAKRTAADEQFYSWAKSAEAINGSKNLDYALRREAEATKQWQNEVEQAGKARNRAALASAEQNAKLSEASVNLDAATGRISKHDAALQMASIHAELYARQIADLNKELARQNLFDPASKETVDAQAAVDKATAERRIQIMQDSAKVAETTWEGALKNANELWLQDSQDTAQQVVAVYTQALNGLNSNLADLMVGDKSNFSGLFKGIGKNLADVSLKRLEAPMLGAFGKADGSEQNPFTVKIAGMGTQSLPGLGRLLFPGMGKEWGDASYSDDDNSDAGSKASGFVGSLGKWAVSIFGGHKAVGGAVKAGVTYDVGEMGREEFTPSSDGVITPNNQLGGNGAAYYHIEVANGVTPEQMNMHVQQALKQYHPKAVSSSLAAMQEQQRRRPASGR